MLERATVTHLGVLYERGTDGAPLAIEVVAARRWSAALLEPPVTPPTSA